MNTTLRDMTNTRTFQEAQLSCDVDLCPEPATTKLRLRVHSPLSPQHGRVREHFACAECAEAAKRHPSLSVLSEEVLAIACDPLEAADAASEGEDTETLN